MGQQIYLSRIKCDIIRKAGGGNKTRFEAKDVIALREHSLSKKFLHQ
jgi:hypothetical protein